MKWKYGFVLALSLVLASCSDVDSVRPFDKKQAAVYLKQNRIFKPTQQMIALALPNRQEWQRIDVSLQTVGTPIMLIPKNETQLHWTQSIRTQIRSDERYPSLTADTFISAEAAEEKQFCQLVDGKLLARNKNATLFSLTLKHCSDKPDQQQFGKILKGDDALYMVYYTWLNGTREYPAVIKAVSDASLMPNTNKKIIF